MITVYVENQGKVEKYIRNLSDEMPYTANHYLLVSEVVSNSKTDTIWTTKQFLDKFMMCRNKWGRTIHVGYMFKRIWEGGHCSNSQHYAGIAADTMQGPDQETRETFRKFAAFFGWPYVEPATIAPTWVHFDDRKPGTQGYPTIELNSVGVYVFILQDCLQHLKYAVPLSGIFDNATRQALMKYQTVKGLKADGFCGFQSWDMLTKQVCPQ